MRGADVHIRSRDGGLFSAYRALPNAPSAPAIVVLTPVFGVDDDMKRFVERFAERGFIAIAPDLFWRVKPGPLPRTDDGRAVAMPRAKAVDFELCAADVRSTVEFAGALPQCNGNVAALGFCFGGRFAYVAAARDEEIGRAHV